MLTKTLPLLMICAVTLLGVGCSSNTSLPPTQAGDPSQAPDFQILTDIPIPSGATMDSDQSVILGERDRWIGRVRIKLWKSAAETSAFYQQQMPAFGWEPIMTATSGVSLMSYIRGDRAATLHVEPTTVGSAVMIVVGPRAQPQGASSQGNYGTAPQSQSFGNGGGYPSREPVRSEALPSRR